MIYWSNLKNLYNIYTAISLSISIIHVMWDIYLFFLTQLFVNTSFIRINMLIYYQILLNITSTTDYKFFFYFSKKKNNTFLTKLIKKLLAILFFFYII
jgi:hypothetical protein